MKRLILFSVLALAVIFSARGGLANDADEGKNLFARHCSICHPSGDNIINRGKTLYSRDLIANNITSAGAVIHVMRNPGPGMSRFDRKKISDKDAKKIAEYILKTFW